MSTLELKELSHPSGEVIKIAAGKTLDLKSQGTTTLPTGSVVQVVSAVYTGGVGTTVVQPSYVDTGLTVSITPSSSASKIIVIANLSLETTGSTHGVHIRLVRGSTAIVYFAKYAGYYVPAIMGYGVDYLDSPNTTSPLTYKVQFAKGSSSSGSAYAQSNESTSTITLMEIQG